MKAREAYMLPYLKDAYHRWRTKVDVDHSNCWLWIGAKYRGGYGYFGVRTPEKYNKCYKAHRFSYEYHNNVRLESSQFVCHVCDNPACVNPNHLYIGDAHTNMQDTLERGRHRYGTQVGHKSLTWDIVRNIRYDYFELGKSYAEIEKFYGISKAQVSRVIKNKIWKKERIL